jgi:hypothetical protein
VLLTSFYERLPPFDGMLRAILPETTISAELIFRGKPEKHVLLDFAAEPLRVLVDDATRHGDVRIAADADVMHEVMLGRMQPGVAVARRQVLMRGSGADLARFMPLFAISPLLYREHLADVGIEGFSRPSGWAPQKEIVMAGKEFTGTPVSLEKRSRVEELLFGRINASAYALGYAMGKLRHRLLQNLSLFEVMSAMSRGMEAAAAGKRDDQEPQ